MSDKSTLNNAVICVIGLGYIGLPLAQAFSRHFTVIGVDINKGKVKTLKEENIYPNLLISSEPAEISKADFNIICVPTPVNEEKKPDLSAIKNAARIIGRNLKKGSTTILESTVYPGVTEEIVKPILEKESRLACGKDFYIGYSPERINPGDDEHSVERVVKVVSGMNDEVTDIIAGLYGKITPKVFKAKNIKTAEAAKISENIQRDLNIALANELSIIFNKIGISSSDVFDAAATKWNYHRYNPGMVGGYCIPVVPYYLVQKSQELGYNPALILAGRKTNNSMPAYIAQCTADALKTCKKKPESARVLVMGLTYKADVAEPRESPVKELIEELKKRGMEVFAHDPLLAEETIKTAFKAKPVKSLAELKNSKIDAVIVTVSHAAFKGTKLEELKAVQQAKPVLIDVPGIFRDKKPSLAGFYYKTL